MSISNTTPFSIRTLGIAAAAALGLTGLVVQAASAQGSADDTYEWSAVLQSYDASSNTAVLQARIETYVEIEGLADFEDGDRLTLVWTGRNWAAGVRDIAENPELTKDTLSLPIEFVSTARDGQYVNFRVQVPDSASATLAGMSEGARVTGISPRQPADWSSAILTMRHYNDVS